MAVKLDIEFWSLDLPSARVHVFGPSPSTSFLSGLYKSDLPGLEWVFFIWHLLEIQACSHMYLFRMGTFKFILDHLEIVLGMILIVINTFLSCLCRSIIVIRRNNMPVWVS